MRLLRTSKESPRYEYKGGPMADPEQLQRLRSGVTTWNTWRAAHPDVRPDLSEANLAGADLTGAKLGQGDLHGAILNGVTLRAADLYEADLRGADLLGADLRGADLEQANLAGVDLTETDLTRADLKRVVLTRARLERTVLVDCDLRGAHGLESCIHYRSSAMDHRTAFRLMSEGEPPVVFLRGCGLPEALIRFYVSQSRCPAGYHSCFISFSNVDAPFARRLHADLQEAGVRCWFAPEDIKIGGEIRGSIHEAIKSHEKLLLVLTRHSIESSWVANEVEAALERERQSGTTVLVPLRLDDAVLESDSGWAADIRRTRNVGDFRSWHNPRDYAESLQRLLRDLRID